MILQAIGAHPVWQALQQHMLKSIPEYVAMIGILILVTIANMPLPAVIREWLLKPRFVELVAIVYKWVYDAFQAFLKLLRPGSPGEPPPEKREEYNEDKEPPK